MRKKIFLIIVGVILIIGAAYYFKIQRGTGVVDPNFNVDTITPPGNKSLSAKLVSMRSSGFEPPTLTVEKGNKVIFRNDEIVDRWPASGDHPTHLSYPEFDPGKPIKSTEVWEFTFDELGTWEYHDHLYPEYEGTIIVVEKLEEDNPPVMSDH